MIIRINKSYQTAIIEACGLRGISVEFFTDERVPELCFMNIDLEGSALLFIGIEIGKILEDQERFEESCKRIEQKQGEDIFNLLTDVCKPNTFRL